MINLTNIITHFRLYINILLTKCGWVVTLETDKLTLTAADHGKKLYSDYWLVMAWIERILKSKSSRMIKDMCIDSCTELTGMGAQEHL